MVITVSEEYALSSSGYMEAAEVLPKPWQAINSLQSASQQYKIITAMKTSYLIRPA
jgi:hypothetical protein